MEVSHPGWSRCDHWCHCQHRGPLWCGRLGHHGGGIVRDPAGKLGKLEGLRLEEAHCYIFFTYVYHLVHGNDDDNNSV